MSLIFEVCTTYLLDVALARTGYISTKAQSCKQSEVMTDSMPPKDSCVSRSSQIGKHGRFEYEIKAFEF